MTNSPPNCLFCSHSEYAPLFDNITDRLGVAPGTWAYQRCVSCGSALLDPFPAAEDLAAYYPPIYTFAPELAKRSSWKRLLADLEFKLYYERQNVAQVNMVLKNLGVVGGPPRKLLDIGCGKGLRLVEFRRKGLETYGMDFQSDSVEYVKSKLGIPAVCTTLDKMGESFAPESFDVITAFYVLEHVTDVRATLLAILKLLKPGGWFVGAVPLIDSVQAKVFNNRWSAAIEAPRHVTLPSREGMRLLCEDVGFDNIAIKPDVLLACAGVLGLSAVAKATTTHLYGGGGISALLLRGLAASVTLAAIPYCAIENSVLNGPCLGVVFGQKPAKE